MEEPELNSALEPPNARMWTWDVNLNWNLTAYQESLHKQTKPIACFRTAQNYASLLLFWFELGIVTIELSVKSRD
jgi:hypothetical protein